MCSDDEAGPLQLCNVASFSNKICITHVMHAIACGMGVVCFGFQMSVAHA